MTGVQSCGLVAVVIVFYLLHNDFDSGNYCTIQRLSHKADVFEVESVIVN